VLQRILSQIEKTICTMGEKIYKPYIWWDLYLKYIKKPYNSTEKRYKDWLIKMGKKSE
jgi:hypothetical protein